MTSDIQVAPAEASPAPNTYFSIVDYAILTVLLVASLLVGTLAGWRSKKSNTKDFLTGGRTMNPMAVSFSLLGGVVSALSVLGNATEMYLYGTQLWMNLVGCMWGTLVVIFVLLPILYPLGLPSLNEYLQIRFKSPTLKKLGSIAQIMNSAMYLGICLYAPSLTLSSVTSLPTWATILVLGIICSVYISMGGVRAVVYTDVLQTTVMFLGVLSVIIQVCVELGGFGEVWRKAVAGRRIEFFNLDPNPLVRHTFWSVQVLGAYFFVSVIGISQPQYQRLVSVATLKTSQGICFAFMIGLAMLWSLFYFSGLVAYAAYEQCDPLTSGKIEKSDQILAFLVADKLQRLPGMTGLFVAAVAGAVLSSLSSQSNALVVMIWEDFLNGWWIFKDITQRSSTLITRLLSSLMGLLSIVMALFVANMGTLFQAAYTISGALVSPLDGLFITAVLAPWVSAKGATSGFLTALVFNMCLIVSKFYYGAGHSEKLPLSTEGCPAEELFQEDVWNATSITATSAYVAEASSDKNYPKILDISYCYTGAMGISTVYIVSSIVSLCTGVTRPDDVDETLVNRKCLAAYKWLVGKSTEKNAMAETPDKVDESDKTLLSTEGRCAEEYV